MPHNDNVGEHDKLRSAASNSGTYGSFQTLSYGKQSESQSDKSAWISFPILLSVIWRGTIMRSLEYITYIMDIRKQKSQKLSYAGTISISKDPFDHNMP